MVHRGHHEGDADSFKRAFHDVGTDHDVDAKLGQRVGCAGLRGQVAVAVLCHADACACDDEGCGGRNVECALAIAPGANDVHRAFWSSDRVAFGAHDAGGGGDFLDGFATGAERHQKAAHLARGGRAVEKRLEGAFGFFPGQRPFGGDADQRAQVIAHAGTPSGTLALSRKVRSIWWPCSDAMDSG